MKSHTPAPFPLKITQADDFFVIITNQGNHYAKTFDPAAAHLIAYAPELLAALEAVTKAYVELVQSDYPPSWSAEKDSEVIAARAAIAKAKGNE
jgi:hypothetical protein